MILTSNHHTTSADFDELLEITINFMDPYSNMTKIKAAVRDDLVIGCGKDCLFVEETSVEQILSVPIRHY